MYEIVYDPPAPGHPEPLDPPGPPRPHTPLVTRHPPSTGGSGARRGCDGAVDPIPPPTRCAPIMVADRDAASRGRGPGGPAPAPGRGGVQPGAPTSSPASLSACRTGSSAPRPAARTAPV